jgi:hypothetical protein
MHDGRCVPCAISVGSVSKSGQSTADTIETEEADSGQRSVLECRPQLPGEGKSQTTHFLTVGAPPRITSV